MPKMILVHLSEWDWTLQATHLACSLARSNRSDIILLRLDFVRHPGYLGTEFGATSPNQKEIALVKACVAITEQYSVRPWLESIQCVTLSGALVNAADQLAADILFAHLPAAYLPYWRRFQTWNLTRRLSALQCQLFTLDKSTHVPERPSSIAITPTHSSVGK